MKHTHGMIKSKSIRLAYASELWQMRVLLRECTKPEQWAMMYGLESGMWAAQKIIMRDMQ